MSKRHSGGHLRSAPLQVERLGDRITPVVGATANAVSVGVNDSLTGVVYLSSTQGIFTGTLLSDGRHILTAAHTVDQNGDHVGDVPVTVRFDLPGGTISMTVAANAITSAPAWTGTINGSVPAAGNDVAILTLPSLAPSGAGGATRYDINRATNEVGQDFTLVGYGQSGTGNSGAIAGSSGTKRQGRNTFDSDSLTLPAGYSVTEGLGLVSDFDNGTAGQDAFAQSYGRPNRGLGSEEASAAPGDSGGPAFLSSNGQFLIAGVSSFHLNGGAADIDTARTGTPRDNVSFGDYSGYTRISKFASYIDATTNTAHTLVIDLTKQAIGNNGTADTLTLRRVENTLEVWLNGTRIQTTAVTQLNGVTIIGSNDADTLILESSIARGLPITWSSIETISDTRVDGAWTVISPPTTPTPPVAGGGEVTTVPIIVPTAPSAGKSPVAASSWYAIGADAGTTPQVKLYDSGGAVRYTGYAFEGSFTGGVRVAVGDVNGDGTPDLVVAPGSGRSPQILILDGSTGATIGNFLAYEASFRGGVQIAVGDLDGDGRAEIITSPDQGGGPRVRIFDLNGTAKGDFLGIDDPNFRGGARVAVGDINGDGRLDLLVGAGFGGGPRIAIFDGTTVTTPTVRKLIEDRFVFEPSLRNGVFLTSGDLNSDGYSDIIVGGGPGGGPRVFALSGKDLLPTNGGREVELLNFFAGDSNQRGGIRLIARNLDGDKTADLIVGGGTGAAAKANVYLNPVTDTNADRVETPFGEGLFMGIFVG